MAEKWFQFVKRIQMETGEPSLAKAMKIASKRKNEWKKDGSAPDVKMNKSKKNNKQAGKTRKNKSSRRRD